MFLCAERRLPHVRLGTGRGTIRIAEDDINKYVKNSRIEQGRKRPRQRGGAAGK